MKTFSYANDVIVTLNILDYRLLSTRSGKIINEGVVEEEGRNEGVGEGKGRRERDEAKMAVSLPPPTSCPV